jgi:hypothetical protein
MYFSGIFVDGLKELRKIEYMVSGLELGTLHVRSSAKHATDSPTSVTFHVRVYVTVITRYSQVLLVLK